MKLAIVGRDQEKLKVHIKSVLPYLKYIDNLNPHLIISLGGDGTFLVAEQVFPGIPKLLVRHDSICNKCEIDSLDEALKRLVAGKYKISEFSKLQAQFNDIFLYAANDVVIRNAEPTHAIRFKVKINNEQFKDYFIGDGVVVSTAFGSQGYYRSIAKKHFDSGFGLAFNNVTINQYPVFLSDSFKIEFTLIRGRAHLVADNNPSLAVLNDGDKVIVNVSSSTAKIVHLTN